MKRLLIIAQKVNKNDDLVGFFADWIKEFSKKFDKVDVISLEVGDYDLPDNVKVYSLGKEKNDPKIIRWLRFYKLLFKLIPGSSGVFSHMSPIFSVASWPITFIFRKKNILWYLHKSVTWKLRLANLLSTKIVTASKNSLNIYGKKIVEVGHGINVDSFASYKNWDNTSGVNLISVGRISKIKNLETLIQAINILDAKNIQLKVDLIGRPIMKNDDEYLYSLKKLTKDLNLEDKINFVGFVSHSNIHKFYKESDIAINLAPRGGVDKVILEAMASGLIVLVANETLLPYFGKFGKDLTFDYGNPESLANNLSNIISMNPDKKREISEFLVESVRENHNLPNTINKITQLFN